MNTSIVTENPGVLYVSKSGLDTKQVAAVIRRLLNVASKIPDVTVTNESFKVNIVKLKTSTTSLYSYVFLEDTGIVNIMQGLNMDGTKRLLKQLKKSCKFFTQTPEVNMKEQYERLRKFWKKTIGNTYCKEDHHDRTAPYMGNYYAKVGNKIINRGLGLSWADFQEQEDNINYDYQPQYDIITLPSLWKTYVDSVTGSEVLPAHPKERIANYKHTVLEANHVDKSISLDQIRKIFLRYDTKKHYILKAVGSDDIERVYYPIVTRYETQNRGSVIRVEFDPESSDAQYAIHMERQLTVNKQQLSFNFPIH